MGEYQSGQMGQTVNLLVFTFGGSNPSSPTSSLKFFCYVLKSFLSLFLRDFKAGESGGRELPFGNDRPTVRCPTQKSPKRNEKAEVAQLVEH